MDFNELQDKIMAVAQKYGQKYHVKIDEDFALLKLYEEVGELAQAILIHHKKSRPEKHVDFRVSKQMVAEELADVVGMAIVNAKLLKIDLTEALNKKWLSRNK